MFTDLMIKNAFTLAIEAHTGQRYGNANQLPFMAHLWNVVGVGYDMGFADKHSKNFDSEITAALWLHDIIEDTDINYTTLKKKTSHRVAELVYLVTDELGRNRVERKQKTLAKIKDNEDGIAVKLCDRIANIEYTIATENTFGIWGMYAKEHSEFVRTLFNSEHSKCAKLWRRLDTIMQKGCH
jgi:(p)ppGpp synthase/HD superfamily hydrolase